ncbi:unnamed protein product [Coffea canephora]|uniref:Uncharacterized protein n=1 Tax=Coffea canephora TaxID=49390 RepID=A0A068VFU4_COFCA|nr:unnamed protein product [Coffea canephora]
MHHKNYLPFLKSRPLLFTAFKRLKIHWQTEPFITGSISNSGEDSLSEPISTALPHSGSDISSPFLQQHLQQGRKLLKYFQSDPGPLSLAKLIPSPHLKT